MTQATTEQQTGQTYDNKKTFPYDRWMEAQGLPIYRGYYIEDLRTIELKDWPMREVKTAFVQLVGMEGINELRVSELAPGQTTKPFKMAVDEIVYVLDGRGTTTVWSEDGGPKRSFEWGVRSMFLLPRHHQHQFTNMQGDRPARLMHYNYLPVSLSATEEAEFFLNSKTLTAPPPAADLYAEAKVVTDPEGLRGMPRHLWYGNFFPDMSMWDKLQPFWGRGAGGRTVFIQFPNSEASCHMSVFAAQTYKKAHRHGPGRAIVIPSGEGYSILWPNENSEKIVVPWHEASLFTPPGRWFHQHFNLGKSFGRYLALHPLPQFSGHSEQVEDRAKDQIEYPDEDPMVRETFEKQLAQRGMESKMVAEAYKDRNYEWDYSTEFS